MKLSILIPCYNEETTIAPLIQRCLSAPLPDDLDREIIVVNDGSTDRTGEILSRIADPRVTVIEHAENRGKGAAVRSGLVGAGGDIVVIQDADFEYNPRDYGVLVASILDGRADVVFGSRFVTGGERRVLYYRHYLANRLLTILSNLCTNLNLTDMETGYKAFRRSILKSIPLHENRFGFEPEITAKVARMGARVYEIGISYSGRTYAEGKKIRVSDAVWGLWCILRYNALSFIQSGKPTFFCRR